jgi:predicted neutral ceramidase superfamily lipid hydrolase
MSLADHFNILEFIVFPAMACTVIVSLPLAIWFRVVHKAHAKDTWFFIVALAALGAVCGMCIGSSRQSVMATVLPALLTLMTALCGYAFTKEGLQEMKPVLPFALLALLLSSLYCTFVGAKLRFINELYTGEVQRDLLRYERVQLEVEKAKELQKIGIPYREPASKDKIMESEKMTSP